MEFKPNQLNDLIKEIRLSLGLTQNDFAKQTGLASQTKVSDIEKGRVKIGFNTLKKVCDKTETNFVITLKFNEQ